MRTTQEKAQAATNATSTNLTKQKAPIGRWYHKGRFQAPAVCFTAQSSSHA